MALQYNSLLVAAPDAQHLEQTCRKRNPVHHTNPGSCITLQIESLWLHRSRHNDYTLQRGAGILGGSRTDGRRDSNHECLPRTFCPGRLEAARRRPCSVPLVSIEMTP